MLELEVTDPQSLPSNAANTATNSKSTELLAFDENHEIQYQGTCKLQINTVSKFLLVKPKNEDFRDITATFDWKFIKQKNIIFVFAKHESQDFALFFNDEGKCSQVYNGIFKKREKDSVGKAMIQERFLISIFKNIPTTGPSRLKELMRKWIRKHDETEKKEYFELLEKYQSENQEMNAFVEVKKETETKPKIYGKRKHREMNVERSAANTSLSFSANIVGDENRLTTEVYQAQNNNFIENSTEDHKSLSSNEVLNIIDESMFKIVSDKKQNRVRRKLLIFSSSEKAECYEYYFYPTKQIFYHRCHNSHIDGFKAILVQDEEGNELIKLENKKHVCSPILYDPEKYMELKIINKPNYKILEECSTKSKRLLIIFDPKDKGKCYEYMWKPCHNKFVCRGCKVEGKHTSAIISRENTEREYIQLLNDQHACEMRKYNPDKFNATNNYVLSPNFEVQIKTVGRTERKTLIIFDKNNRKSCYLYHYNNTAKKFLCNGCIKVQKQVSAKMYQNDDGEEYVLFSNVEHVCAPKEYIPQQKEIILRPPAIKFMEANDKFTSKLFIFETNNPKLCYSFSLECENRYFCIGCHHEKRNTKIRVHLYSDANGGEYYVKMMDGLKHICKPQKYEPEKYERKILKPKDDYVLFRKNGKTSINIAVYHSDDKKLYYHLFYDKGKKNFHCEKCKKKKNYVTAKLRQDSDGNEYLVINQKKHVCKPVTVSSIIKSGNIILEKSGLFGDEEPKKKEKEIDESRILRKPNFEFRNNANGVPDRKLIVFKRENKELCYEYKFNNGRFICKKCSVKAKVFKDEQNDEKYVVLGEKEHSCEPVQYEAEREKAHNYMILNSDDENKPTKLVVFTSSTKEFCYEYTFVSHLKYFRCQSCLTLKKKVVSAKLMKNDGSEEYIQLSATNHFCKPKKFIMEKFQPINIPESGFKLFSNKNRKENSKLILFDPEKNGFVYEYHLLKSLFICNGCKSMKKYVTAKLHEKENGEKYLELSAAEHICESKRYDPEESVEKKTVFEIFVVQHNRSGAPKSKLTIFSDEDMIHGYQYYFQNSKWFRCYGCESIKKYASAKLIIDKDGKQSLQLGKQGHECKVRNLKERNLIFDDFKFEENGNILIINGPKLKHYKFKYDEKLDAFCCIKCKEMKKKIVTATICKDKNQKEFVLLNDAHFCTTS